MQTVSEPAVADAPAAPRQADFQMLVARFIELWSSPVLDRPLVRVGLLTAVVALCLIRAYTGLSGIQVYTHDAFGALDGAWRVLNGQKPHADFYTPLGPGIYLLTALGLVFSHGGAEGFGYSQALCGCLLGVWAYGLSRRRLGHLPAILMCLTVVLLSLNPSSVGEPPPSTSCMAYNRYGYALIGLLLVESVASCDLLARRDERWGGVSTGAILAILLFLKISYFVGAVFLTVALIPCRKQVRDRWAGMFCGFAALFAAFWAYLGFDLAPMWNDLHMVAGAKRAKLNWFIVNNLYLSVSFYLAFIIGAARFLAVRRAPAPARRVLIAGLAVCMAGIFLLSTNFQFYGLPLSAVMAILVLQEIGPRFAAGHSKTMAHAGLLLWGSVFVAGSLNYEAMGLGFGAGQKRSWAEAPHSAFSVPVLAGFRSSEQSYVDLVNDGLALVKEYRREGDTVMSLDFSNPFSYGLGMQPAPGGATTLHYGGNFTDIHHPTAEQLFGQASLVMQPKAPTEPGLLLSIPRIYGPYLASHFHMVGESQGWRLYRRDGEAAPGHAAGQASGPAAAHAAGHAAGHGTGHAG